MEEEKAPVARAMFNPLARTWRWRKSSIPSKSTIKRLRPNFIAIHYMYMLGLTIFGGIILYGANYIPYIDSIFFAAGAATQSGLNTINVNQLFLYQQIVIFLITSVANPIFINTIVVFVRLYWFEKRFTHIVKEVRAQRGTRARTLSRSKSEANENPARLESGLNAKDIKVLHHTTRANAFDDATRTAEASRTGEYPEKPEAYSSGNGEISSENTDPDVAIDDSELERLPDLQPREDAANASHALSHLDREIKFADEIHHPLETRAVYSEAPPSTGQQDTVRHIEFLQRQRQNAHEGATLHIPGPRDFDRGEVPQLVEAFDQNARKRTSIASDTRADAIDRPLSRSSTGLPRAVTTDGNPPERGTIKFTNLEHPFRQDHEPRPTNEQSRHGRHRFSFHAKQHPYSALPRPRRSRSTLSDARNTITRTFSGIATARSRDPNESAMPYLSYEAIVGRNSAFVALTAEQREELGGIEYRALKTLAKILIIYFVGYNIFGMVIYTPWILHTQKYNKIVRADGIDPGWWGVFTAASMFNDLGITLTPNSMNSFAESKLVLLVGSFLIIIGNTGFPVMLRFMIWLTSKCVPYGSALWEELRFLLDHPRRCFTLLFPSGATWWLFWILCILNGIDLIFYLILDLNVPVVTDKPGPDRVLDGWFQATSTRTAGFSCVNLADLHPAIQVSYMIMMYISIFPIAISVRKTNVYEENSLGIFKEDAAEEGEHSYVSQHMRRQLSFDLWYVFLGFFVICIVEGGRLQNPDLSAFSMFSVLFEIVSAYGTVGLSLGYPGSDTSFSGQFHVVSKLVIIAMMIRGRHRGLPYALDRAILLPSESLTHKEAADAEKRLRRASTVGNGNGSVFEAQPRSRRSWRDSEPDDEGVPTQHDRNDAESQSDGPAIARLRSAGQGSNSTPQPRILQRRGSAVSNTTEGRRKLNLARMLVGGLSAGPTYSKYD